MIKITKIGKNLTKTKIIYTITCPECGCEFECEAEDFTKIEKAINGKRWIKCPCCNKELCLYPDDYTTREEEVIETPIINIPSTNPFSPYVDPWIYPKKEDPCDTCPNRFGPRDAFGNPVVGDSMCQWCPHYKYRITYGGDSKGFNVTCTCNGKENSDVPKKL